MRIRQAAAFIGMLCAACEMPGTRAIEKAAAPVELMVRQEAPAVAAMSVLTDPLVHAPKFAPDGSDARPFTTLQSALRAAPSGALLRVSEGVWHERLVITRPLVLMGRGPERTVLAIPAGGAGIEVRADHVQIYGMAIEGGAIGIRFEGGEGHRLEDLALSNSSESALSARGAGITFVSSAVTLVGNGVTGTGIDLDGGTFDARRLVMNRAGRRGIVLHGTRAVLEDLDARGAGLSAVQATDGAEVRVVRGVFEGHGGAALYAGGAHLSVEDAIVRGDDYAVIGYRGADVSVRGGEITDYRVAGVALVKSHGSVKKARIARGGTEAAISILRNDGSEPVLITDNRISTPGTMGVHVTQSTVTARGNTITGARLDPEKDMGDAFYAVESTLVVERNVMRGNAGSGVTAVRSKVRLSDNGFIENGRAGMLLLDSSRSDASGNTFERNAMAAVELSERSRATLSQNRFSGNVGLDIDAGCGKGLAGTAEIGDGNTFATPMRQRVCAE